MYEIKIDDSLYQTYPEIRLGCMQMTVTVTASDTQFWKYLDDEVLPKVRENIEGREWGEIPGVKGSRLAYKAFGRNPGRYRVSSEALLRRVRRGDELYHVNSVVDVNNLISVTSGLSVGSYDLAHIKGTVTLRKAGPGEGYQGIGKDFLDMENMLVLADEEGIFGSSMSDSRRAMVTETAKEILVVVYCFENGIDLEKVLSSGKEAFEKFAYAKEIKTWIVEK
jgi:DNA/RNA-binding domain of Phe-tRNA-synthetase-like protein